ncbi:hypothetical protein [Corynebacterium ammoniagenes]|uniref:Low molecular weight antigen MTB12-like C-terminal domain-containing protein n=2 Tax=Corynebacterium ammoniagenes TaxID=1697 RepID=A0AAV5G4T5_CORAM|nr:hypothetical protein [Corynebacterium ammoniagenes]APT82324.1 hypothetical protein CAMM_05145 [Corynebacterium ammoniagenes DSM 20306]AQS73413.1 hypothetical protein CA40472_05470 [Corynebacterium ammoniagenes]EFG82531.1 hypothetical protein HMPREF0281_00061 [Corynebacterium ammoniagenes DSM 20306]NMF31070.1 hypothetical protein [Corynebacterium ammoniagenes]GJN42152.1 hypothetical protein CAT723_06310 [Corynebacterium ammoniagenes]
MIFRKLTAGFLAATAATALVACSSDSESDSADSADSAAPETQAEESSDAPSSELPTATDLNAILGTATDSAASQEEKVKTVQGGETAPELFETMAASKAESGADFEVVDPVIPGYSPDSVLATVNFTVPEEPAQTAENVEFVFEEGTWKLSQSWACTLISNTVTPDQVPEMCTDGTVDTGANEVTQ